MYKINRKIQMALPEVRRFFSSQPVTKAWLFGSYSREEESHGSDVDILVEYDRGNTKISLMKISRNGVGI